MIRLRRVGIKGSKSKTSQFSSSSSALLSGTGAGDASGPDLIHLVGSHKYTFGRKHCDICFDDDTSVSRSHAQVEVNYPSNDLLDPTVKPNIVVTDMGSKFGTFVNDGISTKTKLQKLEVIPLAVNDRVRFGLQWNEYEVEHIPLIVTSSTLRASKSGPLKLDIWKLGGNIVSEWRPDCDFLVMENITLTIKVVAALVAGKPIVTPQYFTDLVTYYVPPIKSIETKPKPETYLPSVTERGLIGKESKFEIQEKRKTLFVGKLFLFHNDAKLTKFKAVIESGGGRADLITNNLKPNKIQDENTFIVGNQKQLETSGVEIKKVLDIYLSSSKVRTIPESNIGLSVVHMDMDTYCNPFIKNTNPVAYPLVLVSQTQSDSQLSLPTTADSPQSPLRRQVNESIKNPHVIYTQSQTERSVIDDTIQTNVHVSHEPSSSAKVDLAKTRSSSRIKRRIDEVEIEEDEIQILPTQEINFPKRPCTKNKNDNAKRLAAVFGMSSSDEDDENDSRGCGFVIPSTLSQERIEEIGNSETASIIPPTPESQQSHTKKDHSQLQFDDVDNESGESSTVSVVPESEPLLQDEKNTFTFQRPSSQRSTVTFSKRGRNESGGSRSDLSDENSISVERPSFPKKQKFESPIPNKAPISPALKIENEDSPNVKLNCSFQSLLISKSSQSTPSQSISSVKNFKPFRKVYPKNETLDDQNKSKNTSGSTKGGNTAQMIRSFTTVYYHPLEGRIVVVKNDGRSEELQATIASGRSADLQSGIAAPNNENPSDDDDEFQFQPKHKSKSKHFKPSSSSTSHSRINTVRKELEQRQQQLESRVLSQESDDFAF